MTHTELLDLLTDMFTRRELGLVEVDEAPSRGYFLCPACKELSWLIHHSPSITEGRHLPGCNLMKLHQETEHWKRLRDFGK